MAATSNAVQIVIQATDNASDQLKKTTGVLGELQRGVQATIAPLRAMGETLQTSATAGQAAFATIAKNVVGIGISIANVTGPFISFFNTLYTGFSNVASLIETFRTNDAIQVFLGTLAQQADDAISKFEYNIVGTTEGLGKYGAAFLSGIGSTFSQADVQVEQVAATIQTVLPAFDRLKIAVYGTFDAIGARASLASLAVQGAFDSTSIGQAFLSAKVVAIAAIDTIRDHATIASFRISQAFEGSALARGFNVAKILGTVALDEISKKANEVGQNIRLALDGTIIGRTFNIIRVLAQSAFANITEQVGGIAARFEEFKGKFARPVQVPAIQVSGTDVALAQLEGTSTKTASAFSKAFLNATSQVKVGINQIGSTLSTTFAKLESLPGKISGKLAVGAQITGFLGANDAIETYTKIKEGAGGVASTIFSATQELGQFGLGLSALKQLTQGGPFQLLIGQNVELQEQLLATKASLVATNQVIQGGREIKDPTEAIKALEAPVNSAIDRLRNVSLDLVGVTSKDLVPVYQLVAGYSSQIGINLSQVADITASVSAAMGTLKIPLFQARQEVGSILSGTIDMNSVLAKSLGITNQQVSTWKSQGRVYQELTTRLEAFRAGNKLASETINGYTSNIQELFDIIGQKAGAQLLDPITKQLGSLYGYLKENQDALVQFATEITGGLLEGAMAVVESIGEVFKLTVPIGKNTILLLADGAKEAMLALANAIKTLTPIFQPIISFLGVLSSQAGSVIVPFLQMAVTMKTAQFAIGGLSAGFGTFTKLVPGLGEVLALTTGKGNSLIRTISGLSGPLGLGGASALVFGQNLASIPGGAGLVAKEIGKISPLLAPFAQGIAGAVPQISALGVRAVALAKGMPELSNAFGKVLPFIKGNSEELTKMAEKYGPLVDRLIPGASQKILGFTKAVTENAEVGKLRNLVDDKTIDIVQKVGQSLGKTVLSWTVISAAVYLAYQAFDRFILKNKELVEVIQATFSGIGSLVGTVTDGIFSAVSGLVNIIGGMINAVRSLFGEVKSTGQGIGDFLTAPIVLATIAIVGLVAAGEKIALLQAALQAVQLTAMAGGAIQAANGFQSLKIALTEGIGAAAAFQASNGATVVSLKAAGLNLKENILLMKAWIVENFKAAVAMSKDFIAAAGRMIAALATTAVASTRSALAFVFLGQSATGAGNALTLAAVRAKIAALLSSVGAAAATGGAGLRVLATGAFQAATGMLALAGPLIILAGAIALTGLVKYTNDLRVSNDATEAMAIVTDRLSDRSFALATSLKQAQTAQSEKTKAGIRLTDEEYKANQKLSSQAKLLIQDNLAQIQELNSAPEIKGQNKDAVKAQVAQLEAQNKAIQSQLDNVQIAAKELPRLGTAYEQFGQEAKTALEAIRNPSGEADKYKERAKSLLEATQAELKGNLITADDAIVRFQLLATNAGVDKETQIKAREEITAARKIANDKDLADLTAAESKVKILQDSGKIGEAEAERQLSKVKKQELDKQLEDLKQNKADADRVRADDINKQLAENSKKIDAAEKDLAAAQGDPAAAKEVNDRQQSELKSGRAEAVAQIKVIEDEITNIQNDAKGKRGGEAAQADGKVADLKAKLIGLNQDLGKTDDKLSTLDKESKTPIIPGNVNQGEVKAKQEALKAVQIDRARIEKQSDTAAKDSARQFNNDKTKIDENRAKQEADDRKKAYDQKLLFQDEEQKILESNFATKKITEEKFNAESLKSTKTRLDAELAEVNRQKALLPKGDKDGLKKLEAQEADISKRRFEADEKFYQKRQELRLKHSDSLQKIADAQLATGLISEEAYSDQSIKIANKRLDTELEEIARQRKKLAAGDKEGQLALMAQEADIAKKRTEALEKFVQQRSALLEKAEKKALDVAQLAATQRDTQLQELRNKNLIKDEEAGVAQVDSDKARLEAQLSAETEFANKLEKLPQLSNPEKENERQSQIRASRLKTAETTKQIVENEGKQQEARVKLLQALIDRALKDKQNLLEGERQKTQKLLDLQQALADSLEFQNKVLESRKALEQSISDYAQGEFSLASSLTKSAYEKEQIEKRQAEAKLVFLNRQQKLERLSLENDIQKNKALLQREQIQLRLDQLAAAGETADKKAELDKVNADPKSTTRQKKSAQLGVDNASYKEDLLGYKGVVLNAEGKRQEADNANRREALGNKQELEYDGARADYATKSKNIGLQNQLKEEFLQKGNNAVSNYYGAAEQTERTRNEVKTPGLGEYLKSKGRALPVEVTSVSSSQPTNGQARSPNAISQITGAPPAPSLTVPRLAPDQAGGIGQLAGAIAKFNQDVLAGFAKMAGINPSVTQNNEINNYNSGSPSAPNGVGAKTSQDVLNGLYDVFQAVKQRQAT